MGFGGGKAPDYGAIEAQRKREAEAAAKKAKEEAFASELERMKLQRGRASTILSESSGSRGTFA